MDQQLSVDVAKSLIVELYENSTLFDLELPVQIGLLPVDEVVLIVLYSVTTLLSVVGNLAAIVVFTVGRRSRTDLRWFLANLAAADLTMAVFCMPFTFTTTMLDNWIFSTPMCPIVMFFQTVSVTVSVCTSVAVGVDRYWVVNYPLRSRITKSRSPVVIGVIWLVAGALSSVQLVIGRSNTYIHPSGVQAYDCTEVWPEPSEVWRRSYTFFILTITYLLPLALLTFTYGSVSRKLWQRTAPGNADQARDLQQLRSKRKVIKMLVIVVLLFAVCWLPLHAFTFVIDYNPDLTAYRTLGQKRFFVGAFYCVHWLAMSNSFVNPIIYGFLNDCFRSDLKWLARKCFPCCRRLPCCLQRDSSTVAAVYVGGGSGRHTVVDGCQRAASVYRGHDGGSLRRKENDEKILSSNNASGGRGRGYGSTTARLMTSSVREGHGAVKHHVTEVSPAFSRSSTTTAATEISPMCPIGGSLCASGNGISSDGSSSSLPISMATAPASSHLQSPSWIKSGTNGSGRRVHRRPHSTGNGNSGCNIQMVVFTSGSSTMTTCFSGRPMSHDLFD